MRACGDRLCSATTCTCCCGHDQECGQHQRVGAQPSSRCAQHASLYGSKSASSRPAFRRPFSPFRGRPPDTAIIGPFARKTKPSALPLLLYKYMPDVGTLTGVFDTRSEVYRETRRRPPINQSDRYRDRSESRRSAPRPPYTHGGFFFFFPLLTPDGIQTSPTGNCASSQSPPDPQNSVRHTRLHSAACRGRGEVRGVRA